MAVPKLPPPSTVTFCEFAISFMGVALSGISLPFVDVGQDPAAGGGPALAGFLTLQGTHQILEFFPVFTVHSHQYLMGVQHFVTYLLFAGFKHGNFFKLFNSGCRLADNYKDLVEAHGGNYAGN